MRRSASRRSNRTPHGQVGGFFPSSAMPATAIAVQGECQCQIGYERARIACGHRFASEFERARQSGGLAVLSASARHGTVEPCIGLKDPQPLAVYNYFGSRARLSTQSTLMSTIATITRLPETSLSSVAQSEGRFGSWPCRWRRKITARMQPS